MGASEIYYDNTTIYKDVNIAREENIRVMAIDLRFRSATRRGYVSIVREVRGVVVGWWTGFPT